MSSIPKNFLVRFVGGSGGETFCTVLESTNQGWLPNDRLRDGYNRSAFMDLFFNEFTTRGIRDETKTALAIDNDTWNECTLDQIRSAVDHFKSINSRTNIGMSHYPFDKDLDFRHAFEEFFVIDIRPKLEDMWLIRALHLFKSALRRNSSNHQRYSRIFGSEHEKRFNDHVSTNGWWPEWWAWDGAVSFEEFIELDLVAYQTLDSLPPILDAHIDSISLALDPDSLWMTEFRNQSGIDMGAWYNKDYFNNWTKSNMEILHLLGISQHIGKDYDQSKKLSLLRDMMLSRYDQILDFNDNVPNRSGGNQ